MKTNCIDSKMRTHIARNIRLTEKLYGAQSAVDFKFDAIEFCLFHERDVEFATILEKSFPTLDVAPAKGHDAWKRELQERLNPAIRVESNTVNALTQKPSTPAPVTNWQGFGW